MTGSTESNSLISITVNGEVVQTQRGSTVQTLVQSAAIPADYLAIEINEEVVPRGEHGQRELADGDRVEVVTLVGGG